MKTWVLLVLFLCGTVLVAAPLPSLEVEGKICVVDEQTEVVLPEQINFAAIKGSFLINDTLVNPAMYETVTLEDGVVFLVLGKVVPDWRALAFLLEDCKVAGKVCSCRAVLTVYQNHILAVDLYPY